MAKQLAIIADDFTGSNDTGVQFSKKGLKTVVSFELDKIKKISGQTDVVVVDTESRADEKKVAYEKVYKVAKNLKYQNIDYIYKKLDSTLRGNIGSEIEGAMEGGGYDIAIVAPALPANGRKTIGGNQFVHDIPLEKTEIAEDPVTPVKYSYVADIIGEQTEKEIGVINIKDVIQGKDNLLDKLIDQVKAGKSIIVIDSISKKDLDVVAETINEFDRKCLLVGSAGFAESLPEALELTTQDKKEYRMSGAVAGIVGSVSDISREQINYAREYIDGLTVIDVNLENVLNNDFESEITRIRNEINSKLKSNKDVIIRSAKERQMVEKARKIGGDNGLSEREVSGKIAQFMGQMARELYFNKEIKALFMTGGDIAIKSASIIGAEASNIVDEVLPGIPLSYLAGEDLPQKPVVTKAGAFGENEAIAEIFYFLRKWNEDEK